MTTAIKAKKAMLKARDKKNRIDETYGAAIREFNDRVRAWLKAEGWIEESRFNGHKGYPMWDYAYRLPKGQTWHTLNGACEVQKKRSRKAKK